jgi:tRNA(Ile)-lysidine synthase
MKSSSRRESIVKKVEKFLNSSGINQMLNYGRNTYDLKVGVALSGGADSVALLLMTKELGWHPVALHCNFQLRGDESRRDETFCVELCRRLGIEIVVTHFDVEQRRRATGESIEMACRELRYDWFHQQRLDLHLDAIALGHHREDNIETFFLNAMRGSGIAGMKGIPPMRDEYIRPLLSLSKGDILEYLKLKGETYVTDSSNNESEYRRNKIRNELMPVVDRLFPEGREALGATVNHLADDFDLLRSLLVEKRREYIRPDGGIAVARLLQNESRGVSLLYHLLDGAIERDRMELMAEQIGNSGKVYEGRNGQRYLLNRGMLIPMPDEPIATANGDAPMIEARIIPKSEFRPERNPDKAWFDLSILEKVDKLIVRHPQTGDKIKPFGMTGSRLLSDVFSDKKLSMLEKSKQWVVVGDGETLWIPGVCNSRHFPVTDSTENILELHIRYVAKK